MDQAVEEEEHVCDDCVEAVVFHLAKVLVWQVPDFDEPQDDAGGPEEVVDDGGEKADYSDNAKVF